MRDIGLMQIIKGLQQSHVRTGRRLKPAKWHHPSFQIAIAPYESSDKQKSLQLVAGFPWPRRTLGGFIYFHVLKRLNRPQPEN
jgi:hypothetical protein